MYKELLVAFLSHLSVQRLELEDAAANEDVARAQDVAHQIKGTALSFGAARLDALATRLLDIDVASGELLSSLVTEIDTEISTLQELRTGVEPMTQDRQATADTETPMTGVVVMTTQLNDSETSIDHKMLAETVLVSGEGLVSLLADILEFAAIESGRHDLESIAFDLRSLVQDVTDLLRAPAQRDGIELTCQFPDDMPTTFRGDPGRLRRVVTDLVANALKFTPSGEVLLELFVEDRHEGDVMIRFEVVGVGFGITRAHRPAVLRIVLSGRHRHHPLVRWRRARSGPVASAGRVDGGQDRCPEQSRPRQHLLVQSPPRQGQVRHGGRGVAGREIRRGKTRTSVPTPGQGRWGPRDGSCWPRTTR